MAFAHAIVYRPLPPLAIYHCSKWRIRSSTEGSPRRFLNRLDSFKIKSPPSPNRLSRLLTWPDSLLIHLGIGDSSISTKRVPHYIGMYRALSHSALVQGLGSPYLELPREAPRGALYGHWRLLIYLNMMTNSPREGRKRHVSAPYFIPRIPGNCFPISLLYFYLKQPQ